MSDEKLYQVILLPHKADADVPLANVQKNLATAFNVDEEKIEALFEKSPTIIKSGIDKSTADLFRDAIIRSGADCEVREQTTSSPPKPRKTGKSTTFPSVASEPAQDKILELLRSFQPQAGLHVHPRIPEKKLKNALERCRVHPMETVVGLIDCTVFGSAKSSLLLTNNGIYYSNDVQGTVPGGTIPYYELARRELELDGEFEISLGKEDALETSASPMERERILALLEAMQKLFKES
jgi:hypothetical protein